MFRKRQKKIFPPGTFIRMPARICAIIQLCLAFTIILWNAAQPFSGELFSLKSKLVLYEDITGSTPRPGLSVEKIARLDRNAKRFEGLSEKEAEPIVAGHQKVKDLLKRSFIDKLASSWHLMLYEIPPFEQAWLILSLIIPILLLKRVEGAAQVVWLLPLLSALYAFDNRAYGHRSSPSAESMLFPTEQRLVAEFMKEPLSANVFEQQGQLQDAWKAYLIKVWTPEDPGSEFAAEQGEFAFNLARARAIGSERISPISGSPHIQEPLLILGLYVFWNALFASVAYRNLE